MPKPVTKTAEVPPWLAEMRRITGLKEQSGSGSNPLIMKGPKYIAEKYPHQEAYCDYYTDDSIAWCGLTVAYCMAVANIEPVFGPTDTDRWMWAQAWGGKYWEADEIDEPRVGAVIVMQREGGGHVTLMEAYDDGTFLKDGYYMGRGGNQSDMVNVSKQAKSSVIKLMWPRAAGRPPLVAEKPEETEGYKSVVISSGHGKLVRGASGILDEVDEARRVVESVAKRLKGYGVEVKTFHDNTSITQDENLHTIVKYHNAQERELDISVHFNAYQTTTKPMGTEVLYVSDSGEEVAGPMSAAIAKVGFINRGAKHRGDLFFLNNTEEPAILIETCFVDSSADANIYNKNFDNICEMICSVLVGDAKPDRLPDRDEDKPVAALPPMPVETQEDIFTLVNGSKAANYSWKDRGKAPIGYSEGMALGFATVVRKYKRHHDAALEMGKANTGNDDKDALAWYDDIFISRGMSNKTPGLNTLRHLWVLLWGLGMRESSGKHCEGRDMSADNVSSETAEAGLFQMSANALNCHEQMRVVMEEYAAAPEEQGGLSVFQEGVKCSEDDWECYGSGEGLDYQRLAKSAPQFACEAAAIGLRNLRQHWGPINRHEVEVRKEVDDLLKDVQALFDETIV